MNRACSSLEVKPRSPILMLVWPPTRPKQKFLNWLLVLFFLLHFFSSSYYRVVVFVTISEIWLPSLPYPQHRTTFQLLCCVSRIYRAATGGLATLEEVPRTLDVCRPECHFDIPPCVHRSFFEIVRSPDERWHMQKLHRFRVVRRYLSRADSNLTPF